MSATFRPAALIRQRLAARPLAYGLGFLAIMVANVGESLIPKFIQWTLDLLLGQPLPRFGGVLSDATDKTRLLLTLASGLLVVLVICFLCKFAWRMMLFRETHLVGHDLKNDLWSALLRMPATGHEGLRFGDLMNRISNDWNRARIIHGYTLANSFDYLVLVVLSFTYMLNIHVKLSLVVMSPLLLLPVISFELGKLQQSRFLSAQETLSQLYETIAHSIKSVRLQRATATEPFWLERLGRSATAYAHENYGSLNIGNVNVAVSFIPYFVSMAILFSYGIFLVRQGEISIGAYATLHVYMMVVHDVIADFGALLAEWRMGFSSYRRLHDILKQPKRIESAMAAFPAHQKNAAHTMEIVNLGYGYPGSARLIGPLHYRLVSGRRLGVIGRVGTGKSTFALLVSGLLDGYEGQIRIDGREVGQASRAWIDARVTLIQQKPMVLACSVRVNLDPSGQMCEARLIESLHMVELWDEIAALPHGLDQAIGEGGAKLSGGQKQRLCLARAILCDTPIMVLDDGLSAIDPSTERIILERLWTLWRDKIVILITHRSSDLLGCNGVLDLDLPSNNFSMKRLP